MARKTISQKRIDDARALTFVLTSSGRVLIYEDFDPSTIVLKGYEDTWLAGIGSKAHADHVICASDVRLLEQILDVTLDEGEAFEVLLLQNTTINVVPPQA